MVSAKHPSYGDNRDYRLFFRFIETFSGAGFNGIDRNNPLMLELEAITEKDNQFFLVGDTLQMKILFTSNRSTQIMGVRPDEISPYHFRESVHPEDAQRHGLSTTQLFKITNELFINKGDSYILSSNFRFRNPQGFYSNLLVQCYVFYREFPYKTVFLVQVHTDIDWYKKIRHGYHHYTGNDISKFRYPDDKLLTQGNIYSDREFEIIKLIHSGFESIQIAEKLFLSIHTINTHRSNILEKSGKRQIADVIFDLKEKGLL
jgi:hypothetical protein